MRTPAKSRLGTQRAVINLTITGDTGIKKLVVTGQLIDGCGNGRSADVWLAWKPQHTETSSTPFYNRSSHADYVFLAARIGKFETGLFKNGQTCVNTLMHW